MSSVTAIRSGSGLVGAPEERNANLFSSSLASSRADSTTSATPASSAPTLLASGAAAETSAVENAIRFLDTIAPDGALFGATAARLPPGGAAGLAPFGNFVTVGRSGNIGYFGARTLTRLPDVPTPLGPIRSTISVLGTAGQTASGDFTDQAGAGIASVVPTPRGDLLLFFNMRQDAATVGNVFQQRGTHLINANFGVAYAVSYEAALALSAKFPKAGIPLAAGMALSGSTVWAGVGYSRSVVQLEVTDGVPQALIVGGNRVPLDQVATLFGDEIEDRAMRGGYRPDSLNRSVLRDFNPRYTNIQQEGSDYAQVIQRAFDRQLTDPTEQYRLLTDALANPEATFGEMSPDGRKAALMVINSILGREGEAERLARELYPYDNTVDGTRPRGLSTLRIDSLAELDGARSAGQTQAAPSRVSYGFAGVPGVGQVEIRYNPADGVYSAHGRNNAQHPLRGATTLEEAGDLAREVIRNGGFSRENLFPLQGHDGTRISTIPAEQPARVSQGFVGVPGVGQAEIRYNTRDGVYSLHGRNEAQHPLSGARSLQEAQRQGRELISNGGFSAQNLFPLQGHDGTRISTIPTDQPARVSQGFVGVPGVGQAEIRYNTRDGVYSLHGRNEAQHPLSGARSLQEAQRQGRELIANGGFSAQNLFPLQGHDGTRISTIPTDQPERVSQGFVGVPGVGQAEIRYNTRDGVYSLHGRNGAQHPLHGALTKDEARERGRELIRNGGFSPQNLFPL